MKAMATVAGLTGISRIAGFTRDIMMASVLGAGPIADAFFIALKLPNFFRRVTAEGAFSVSFVPIYAQTLKQEGEEAASAFASQAFAMMLWSLLAITLLAMLFMPLIIYAIAPGFEPEEMRFSAAIEMARVTFPYLLLMSLTALMGGILNAHDRFAPFAAAPIVFNLTLIGALFLSGFFETAGHALSWGVFTAGFLQFLLLYVCMRRAGLRIKALRPRMSPKVKRLLFLMGPGVLGAGVMHVNLFADLIIASFLEAGSISYLYYADRLNQLPLGMVGIAVGTALLPMLSRSLASNSAEDSRHLFNRALEVSLLLALPAATGLCVIAAPVIMTLFQHGAFTVADATVTASVLMAYTLGMPAYIAIKVYSTAYWAHQDTLTPVKAAVAATIVNVGMSVYLSLYTPLGVAGIALSTSLAGWMQIWLLSRGLKAMDEVRADARLKRAVLRIVAGCVVMAAVLYGLSVPLAKMFAPDMSTITQIGALSALVLVGASTYGLVIIGCGVVKLRDIKNIFRK